MQATDAKSIQIGIVEDEAIIAMSLAALLQKCGYEVAFTAATYSDAWQYLQHTQPRLLLVDIQLAGEKTGIELAQDIYATSRIPVVFLTANADALTVQQAKQAHPVAYLVKPFNEESLYATIEVALNRPPAAALPETAALLPEPVVPVERFPETLFIRQGTGVYKVAYAAIRYVESDDTYLHLYTTDRKYTLRMTLTALQEQLKHSHFMRIHKSYLINCNHLDALSGEMVVIGGQRLPIGRAYKADLLKQLPLL